MTTVTVSRTQPQIRDQILPHETLGNPPMLGESLQACIIFKWVLDYTPSLMFLFQMLTLCSYKINAWQMTPSDLCICICPGGSDGKESHLQCWRPGFDPWVGKILWRREGYPLQYSCLENPHGQRSLTGYSPWCPKESDTIERLSLTHMHTCIIHYICYISSIY